MCDHGLVERIEALEAEVKDLKEFIFNTIPTTISTTDTDDRPWQRCFRCGKRFYGYSMPLYDDGCSWHIDGEEVPDHIS